MCRASHGHPRHATHAIVPDCGNLSIERGLLTIARASALTVVAVNQSVAWHASCTFRTRRRQMTGGRESRAP
jgi:hypothetical protein